MAEFLEVMETKKRMCETTSRCSQCGLDSHNNNRGIGCMELVSSHPQEAEKIIVEWAKEHPIKRNIDILKETFGMTFLFGHCDGLECPSEKDCPNCENRNFWESEYKEQK